MRKIPRVGRGDWPTYVKRIKVATGLKTGRLAALAGISPETWWRWENRGQRPKELDVLERFARGLSLELDEVLWAAGMTPTVNSAEGTDPRIDGLDPNDTVVQQILTLDVPEDERRWMLDRRRQILKLREEQDLAELELLARRQRDAA